MPLMMRVWCVTGGATVLGVCRCDDGVGTRRGSGEELRSISAWRRNV